MSKDTPNNWPTFELVPLKPADNSPPGAAQALSTRGVPRDMLGRFSATDRVTLVDSSRGLLACFAETGLYGKLCLDLSNGAVVEIAVPGMDPRLVNSDLDRFIATVRAVIERFPFYNLEGDPDDWEQERAAKRDLIAIITRIDPDAMVRDGFWETFVDDVEMGDFSTEQVTGKVP